MNSSCGCQRRPNSRGETGRQNTWFQRVKKTAGWILPGTLLALMPKCPVCLAAYVALCTGFTISYSSAHILMRALTVLSVGMLALCATKFVLSWQHKKQTLNLQTTQP